MTYDIFGWVEVAKRSEDTGSWLAVLDLSEIVGHPDEFSRNVFGLSKWTQGVNAPFFERGLPENPSREVQDELASIAMLELEEWGDLGFHGFTYATLEEIKRISIPSGSSWDLLLIKISMLQLDSGYSDSEVRLIIWALW
jgi:hypothetical protein